VFRNGGLPSLFGVKIIVLNEMGVAQPYNYAFDELYTAAGGEPGFAAATDELVIGVDASVPAFIKIVESGDSGETVVEPDDQWVRRSEKIGFYAARKEGRIVTDTKAIAAIVV
jgi:hypothetical protein